MAADKKTNMFTKLTSLLKGTPFEVTAPSDFSRLGGFTATGGFTGLLPESWISFLREAGFSESEIFNEANAEILLATMLEFATKLDEKRRAQEKAAQAACNDEPALPECGPEVVLTAEDEE